MALSAALVLCSPGGANWIVDFLLIEVVFD